MPVGLLFAVGGLNATTVPVGGRPPAGKQLGLSQGQEGIGKWKAGDGRGRGPLKDVSTVMQPHHNAHVAQQVQVAIEAADVKGELLRQAGSRLGPRAQQLEQAV